MFFYIYTKEHTYSYIITLHSILTYNLPKFINIIQTKIKMFNYNFYDICKLFHRVQNTIACIITLMYLPSCTYIEPTSFIAEHVYSGPFLRSIYERFLRHHKTECGNMCDVDAALYACTSLNVCKSRSPRYWHAKYNSLVLQLLLLLQSLYCKIYCTNCECSGENSLQSLTVLKWNLSEKLQYICSYFSKKKVYLISVFQLNNWFYYLKFN